jgi:hypothetical protein
MRKSMIFTLVVVIGFCLTGYAFADDKALENEVYYDKNTGLEWLAGPDKATNWYDAKKWVESLTAVAGGGWRMPTRKELKTLYQKREKCNIKPIFKTTGCWVWSGETKGSSLAWGYDYSFEPGGSILSGGSGSSSGPVTFKQDDSSDSTRGFAVRSRK